MTQLLSSPDMDVAQPEAELSAKSRLVSSFFDFLNGTDAVFCVMNNYADLPKIIPSDVDIAIDSATFARLDALVARFADQQGVAIVQKLWHGNRKCAYILSDLAPAQPYFIQLDFFVEFSTSHCPRLLGFDDLVHDRRRLRNFFVPNPDCELVFIAMRRIFKNDWSTRHCDRLAQLARLASRPEWTGSNFGWLQPVLDLAIAGKVDQLRQRRKQDWSAMKRFAWRRLGAASLLDVVHWQSRRILYRLRNETGNLSVLLASNARTAISAEDLAASLAEVFYRVTIEEELANGAPRGLRAVFLAARLKFTKLRKGVIIVPLDPGAKSSSGTVALLARWKLLDQVLVAGRSQPKIPADGIASFQASTTEEAAAIILDSQVRKTAQALVMPSQTSGSHCG